MTENITIVIIGVQAPNTLNHFKITIKIFIYLFLGFCFYLSLHHNIDQITTVMEYKIWPKRGFSSYHSQLCWCPDWSDGGNVVQHFTSEPWSPKPCCIVKFFYPRFTWFILTEKALTSVWQIYIICKTEICQILMVLRRKLDVVAAL